MAEEKALQTGSQSLKNEPLLSGLKIFTIFVRIHLIKSRMKRLMQLALAASFAGICLSACSGYSAQDYVSDMKALTEETVRNAASYSEEDWKRVSEEYRAIHEKGKEVLENLTEEQKRELEQYAEDVTDKAAEFDHEELKAQFEDIADRADELIDGLMEKLNAND